MYHYRQILFHKEAEGTNELDLDKDQEIKELDKNGESDADKFYEEKKLSEEVEEFDVDAELDPNGYPSDLPSEDPQPVVDPVDPIESAEGATDVEVEVNDDEEEEDIDAVLDPVIKHRLISPLSNLSLL